ncbi:hypothetical protein [Acinetobacter sp. c1-l78]
MNGDIFYINAKEYKVEILIDKVQGNSSTRFLIFYKNNKYDLLVKDEYRDELLLKLSQVLGKYQGELNIVEK